MTVGSAADRVMERLTAAGLVLTYSPETDRLNVKPTAKVTPELAALVKEHRSRIVAALRRGTARPPKVTTEMVRAILDQPPYWLAGSYLPAYTSGRYSLDVLAYGVTAALGRSAYDDDDVDAVVEILIDMGYGAEGVAAVLV